MKTPAESLSFRQSLLEVLEADPRREEKLLEKFEETRGKGDALYSPLLYLLTHLNFTEAKATRHWKRIVAHREKLARLAGPRPRAPGGASRLLREREPRAEEPEDDRAGDLRAHRALGGDRRPDRPLQPRLLPAGAAAGGPAVEATRAQGVAPPPGPRRLQAGQRPAGPRGGRPHADEGRGDHPRRGAGDRHRRAVRRRGVRGAAARHLPAGRLRRGRAHPAPGSTSASGASGRRSRSRAGSPSSPTTPAPPPTSSSRPTPGSTAPRRRERTGSSWPRARGGATAGSRWPRR